MHERYSRVIARLDRFLLERLAPAQYRVSAPLAVTSWEAPGEPVAFAQAATADFTPVELGSAWGRPWGTTWFHLTGAIPADWNVVQEDSVELVVDLGFTAGVPGFQAEALVYRADGTILGALEPLNRSVVLAAAPGDQLDIYIEAASNPDIAQRFTFKRTLDGDPRTAATTPTYVLRTVDVAVLATSTWQLIQDLSALRGLAMELPSDRPRRNDILAAIERALDAVDPDQLHETAGLARAQLEVVLASPAHASAHRVHAVGHAHIDSAWLWPLRETRRKVARTFSNVLNLLERYPDFVFAASSAQQYAWIKEDYPELYSRVRAAVAGGRFIPIGGQWIEPDSNLPGGEALARQFIEGKKFFIEEFGIEPREVWVPDSFGYSAALPQIARAAGSDYFLTQKLSWNETNSFPHHSFLWEGIDGTRIFTHFPPADTYNSMVDASELHGAERRYRETGEANSSLLPFGWGDGGGGPTREMLEAANRFADLEGSPRVILSTPRRFFEEAEAEYRDPPVWVGELYLEAHRGVATTQIEIKRGNRRNERVLREAEHWSSHAAIATGYDYPYATLQRLWRELLLLQFHDILPGTSIAWVHREAVERHSSIHAEAERLVQSALRALLGSGASIAAVNGAPLELNGIAAFGTGTPVVSPDTESTSSRAQPDLTLENERIRIRVDDQGHISSAYDKRAERELVPAGASGALLQLHRDIPTQWDAWNIDENYRAVTQNLTDADSVAYTDSGGIRVERHFGSSKVSLEYSINGATISVAIDLDWQENEKILKLAFPLALHASRAASEIQYGHVFRDIHTNTSWDAARFETVAHRWLHVSEPDYGVALANEVTYGYDISRSVHNGESSVTVRASLARAPQYPDPESDRGRHSYKFALTIGADLPTAIAEGYRLNIPIRTLTGVAGAAVAPLVAVDNPAIIIEAVKLADDKSGDLVVRLYESQGTRAIGAIQTSFEHADVAENDLLERPAPRKAIDETHVGSGQRLVLHPFQLVTLRFYRNGSSL